MFARLYEEPYNQMFFYTGHSLGDIDGYNQCQFDLNHTSEFSILSFNFSRIAIPLHLGLCLPKECT